MESDRSTVWKSASLAKKYLEGVREAIPLADEQLNVMLRLIEARGHGIESFLDLGCGDGVLSAAIFRRYPQALSHYAKCLSIPRVVRSRTAIIVNLTWLDALPVFGHEIPNNHRKERVSMAENSDFLVGITPDWTDWTERMLGPGLRQVFDDVPDIKHELMPADTNKVLSAEVLRRYDAVIVFGYKVRRESLEGVEKLLCVSRYGVGFDTVDIAACNEANVLVSITPGGVQRSMAEGTISLIFSIAKNLRNYDQWVREGTWSQKLSRATVNVQGRTLGSVGLGNIASEVMRLAKGVGFGRLIGDTTKSCG